MDILALQQKCQGDTQSMFVDASVITLDQFYGIELLDFPHEVAMLSLWLAEHQMNTKLNDIVESCYPGYPFASDEARLECLFKLYEKMTAKK